MHSVTMPFNAAPRRSRAPGCLPDLLDEQARFRPDDVAVVDGTDALTFGVLERESGRLGELLRRLGVGSDGCVGVHAEPSIELALGVWGVLKAGGAYLPLSPDYPDDRLRFMIADAGVKVIVCQEHLARRLRLLAPRGTRVVSPRDGVDAGDGPGEAPRPDSLAYVIYTSGSTGRPKGVMIEHRSVVNQLSWLRSAHALGRARTVLQKTPFSFDAAQWEILATGCGSRVAMPGGGAHRDPRRLVDAIKEHGVTTLQCVPTLLRALLDTDDLRTCTSLEQLFSGGEALTRKLARRCLEALPWCQLVNLYGPTECTINASSFTVDRHALAHGCGSVPIGLPVRNTQLYVLDEHLAPAAPGEIGELCIAGVQVARGYLGRGDLTAERFVPNPFSAGGGHPTLYRTGDLGWREADGTVQFAGRADNQVKLRGCRVELDEIGVAIETHDWVNRAAVIARTDDRTQAQSLVAFVELNPREAALMDQGADGGHHRSKASKLQVKAQLSNAGCRSDAELHGRAVVDLPGKLATAGQRREAFARKTYRFYEGGRVARSDLIRLLSMPPATARPRDVGSLALGGLGTLLRSFGQYLSAQRLLPKYGYASPGALYATQMYFELGAFDGIDDGCWYYHPVRHALVRVGDVSLRPGACRIAVHFVGKPRAIQPVYEHNVREVLELEAGHMAGLWDEILPRFGLALGGGRHTPPAMDRLDVGDGDLYLCSFELEPYAPEPGGDRSVDVYVQAREGAVADLPGGHYRYYAGDLDRISGELIRRRDVIAINQRVYDRASFGMSVVSRCRDGWLSYVELGRKLQRLSMNGLNLGFMSAGYSSRSGRDLPSARRLEEILRAAGETAGPSYFFVGGRVSDEQVRSEGMKEDLVHAKGPAELITDDLSTLLPEYMMPSRVVLLDRLPRTVNGKVDRTALPALDDRRDEQRGRAYVAPRTATEERIVAIWRAELGRDEVSVHDDFFDLGGDSLSAVALIDAIGDELGTALPLQTLFGAPTVERLAARIDDCDAAPSSRLVALRPDGSGRPVFCWPGLGGYTMNLRELAGKLELDRPFYGVQARGVNAGERPYGNLTTMAQADMRLIRRCQPIGPYTLWGYSFGARVAIETAHQLERDGERVDHVLLIAPGSPPVACDDASEHHGLPTFASRTYVSILLSVFAGGLTDPALRACLELAHDEESFAAFVADRIGIRDCCLVRRVTAIVAQTYAWAYAGRGVPERHLRAPITVIRARGDARSFAECSGRALRAVVDVAADHYGVLKEPGVRELVALIRGRFGAVDCADARVA